MLLHDTLHFTYCCMIHYIILLCDTLHHIVVWYTAFYILLYDTLHQHSTPCFRLHLSPSTQLLPAGISASPSGTPCIYRHARYSNSEAGKVPCRQMQNFGDHACYVKRPSLALDNKLVSLYAPPKTVHPMLMHLLARMTYIGMATVHILQCVMSKHFPSADPWNTDAETALAYSMPFYLQAAGLLRCGKQGTQAKHARQSRILMPRSTYKCTQLRNLCL